MSHARRRTQTRPTAWDGYPAHKHELLAYLREHGIHNVIAITEDLHAFRCGVVRDDPDPATGVPAIVDFVCAGISSTSFYSYLNVAWNGTPLASITATPARLDSFLTANNPDLCHADHDAQGYASATVTPEYFSVTFNKVKPLNPDGAAPADALLGRTRLTVPRDSVDVHVEHMVVPTRRFWDVLCVPASLRACSCPVMRDGLTMIDRRKTPC